MNTAFVITDMHCAGCAARIRKTLEAMNGVERCATNPVRRQLFVSHTAELPALALMEALERIGFHPTLHAAGASGAAGQGLLRRLGVAGLCGMQVMMASIALYFGADGSMAAEHRFLLTHACLLLSLPVVFYAAQPFFAGALNALRARRVSMDTPVAIAIAVAFGVSAHATLGGTGEVYFDSAVMFTFLLLVARVVDERLRAGFTSTSRAIADLPRTCRVLRGTDALETPVADVVPGDRLWVRSDDLLPVDGELGSERGWVDEATLTGESSWSEKRRGDPVYAGTMVKQTAVEIVAVTTGVHTRIHAIEALADAAQAGRSRALSIADRAAGLFVPAILGLAVLTLAAWAWFDAARALPAALAVLVVSCPCALALATPAAVTAALARARREGGLVASAEAMEKLESVTHVLLDKTGTLTDGRLTLSDVHPCGDWDADTCAAVAAGLERHANHPVARAFDALPAAPVAEVESLPGVGVTGRFRNRTVVIQADAHARDKTLLLTADGAAMARFELVESLRADAADAVAALRRLGLTLEIASGDGEGACRPVAERLAIPFVADRSPEQKLARIEALQRDGAVVLAVGDGANDVPALAAADVAVAVLETSDLVRSKADALLLTRSLRPLAAMLRGARQARRVVRQNLTWALAYNVSVIPFAALGVIPPWAAAAGMSLSSIAVVANAARLSRTGA